MNRDIKSRIGKIEQRGFMHSFFLGSSQKQMSRTLSLSLSEFSISESENIQDNETF
jgi:hypothetical protein